MIKDTKNSFLLDLTERLSRSLQDFEPERAARHVGFLMNFQQPDGGFSGRRGGSDLYYTGFAVRGLALLGALDRPRCAAIANYLKGAVKRRSFNLIDLTSWFYSAITIQTRSGLVAFDGDQDSVANEVASALESFRRADGGYAKTHEGGAGSTYHTFLAVLCYEMLDRTPPDIPAIARFLLARRRDDGGFVEIGPMKQSGANPTAAAAVLLNRFAAIDGEALRGIESYLQSVRGVEGGLRANTQIPFCDLLSTFTGLLVAHDLGLSGVIDQEACRRYVNQLELSGGGFRGAAWDSEADPEYTFYGLGALALLA